jgi:hypothetical protein
LARWKESVKLGEIQLGPSFVHVVSIKLPTVSIYQILAVLLINKKLKRIEKIP